MKSTGGEHHAHYEDLAFEQHLFHAGTAFHGVNNRPTPEVLPERCGQ